MPFFHWLFANWAYVHFGVRGAGPWYGFFSGFGSDLGEYIIFIAIASGVIGAYRKVNCHRKGCWRFGHYPFLDQETGVTHKLCRKCHPDHPGHKLTMEHFARIHAKNKLLKES